MEKEIARIIVSEGKNKRQLIEHFKGIGISKKTGKTKIIHRTVHQTKINNKWVNNVNLPKKPHPPRNYTSVLKEGFKH